MLTTLPGFCPEAASASDWSLVSVVEYAECFAPEDTVALARCGPSPAALPTMTLWAAPRWLDQRRRLGRMKTPR
jgi:hypothetical protein